MWWCVLGGERCWEGWIVEGRCGLLCVLGASLVRGGAVGGGCVETESCVAVWSVVGSSRAAQAAGDVRCSRRE